MHLLALLLLSSFPVPILTVISEPFTPMHHEDDHGPAMAVTGPEMTDLTIEARVDGRSIGRFAAMPGYLALRA